MVESNEGKKEPESRPEPTSFKPKVASFVTTVVIIFAAIATGTVLLSIKSLPWWVAVELSIFVAVAPLIAIRIKKSPTLKEAFSHDNVMIFLTLIALVISALGILQTTQGNIIAINAAIQNEKMFEYEIRPALIVHEVNQNSNSAIFLGKTYRISHIPEIQHDKIDVSLWNIGGQPAQNVTVFLHVEPQDSNWANIGNSQKCIGLQCFNARSNLITFRAIEPNGFYSVNSSFDFNSTEIKERKIMNLVVTIDYFDSKQKQQIIDKYTIESD